ncbi:hypothetical protein EGR_10229 [Echinococcus granulosus]|uniref:Uncharacterized protein n=1 Tax=Echinococcus granulosus TaxID=6210 RepID=W6UN05_ECHGR|nr:hypothetical protein EGR_10229 [Echinococcus granulosus]EUB54919.1 hypothetical protein EGR_10229 [Echinococcus granulosus]
MDQMEDSGLERRFCEVLRVCSQSAVFFPFRLSLPMVIRLLLSLLPPPLLMEYSTLTSFVSNSFHRFFTSQFFVSNVLTMVSSLMVETSRRLHMKKVSSKEKAAYRCSMETWLSGEFCTAVSHRNPLSSVSYGNGEPPVSAGVSLQLHPLPRQEPVVGRLLYRHGSNNNNNNKVTYCHLHSACCAYILFYETLAGMSLMQRTPLHPLDPRLMGKEWTRRRRAIRLPAPLC